MREGSSIPSHSFQDLLISAEESLQGNRQAESCQAPPLRDTPPRHGIVWTSTFGNKIKTAGNPCRQPKILCGHCGPLSGVVLIAWSDHASYTNLCSCLPTWNESWSGFGFRASWEESWGLRPGRPRAQVSDVNPSHSPCRRKEWGKLSLKKSEGWWCAEAQERCMRQEDWE